MTTDNLTRARAVLAGLRTAEADAEPAPWTWEAPTKARTIIRHVGGLAVLVDDDTLGEADATFITESRNAAPALIRLAEAELAGRAAWADARKARSQSLADADYAEAYKRGQAAAAEVDAALADLAALDGGDAAPCDACRRVELLARASGATWASCGECGRQFALDGAP